MAHTVPLPEKAFFYPLGYTAPVSLTQELPPEQQGRILLLGCDDPRSIFYTIFSDVKIPNGKYLPYGLESEADFILSPSRFGLHML
jgi:hypothetical protein